LIQRDDVPGRGRTTTPCPSPSSDDRFALLLQRRAPSCCTTCLAQPRVLLAWCRPQHAQLFGRGLRFRRRVFVQLARNDAFVEEGAKTAALALIVGGDGVCRADLFVARTCERFGEVRIRARDRGLLLRDLAVERLGPSVCVWPVTTCASSM
jgi:hypothetical protein